MSAPDPIEPLSPMVVGPSSRRNQAIGAVMYLVAAFLFALNGSSNYRIGYHTLKQGCFSGSRRPIYCKHGIIWTI